MVHKGLIPDEVTSLRVLSGCNHAGLAKEGKLVCSAKLKNRHQEGSIL